MADVCCSSKESDGKKMHNFPQMIFCMKDEKIQKASLHFFFREKACLTTTIVIVLKMLSNNFFKIRLYVIHTHLLIHDDSVYFM